MPQMRIALRAPDFRSPHAMRHIRVLLNRTFRQRLIKTRPSRARLILCLRAEQRLSATHARIRACVFRLVVLSRERRLRPRLPRDIVLLRRQFLLPFRFCFINFGRHSSRVPFITFGRRQFWCARMIAYGATRMLLKQDQPNLIAALPANAGVSMRNKLLSIDYV
jgi:hypothetical protein